MCCLEFYVEELNVEMVSMWGIDKLMMIVGMVYILIKLWINL